MKGLVILFLGLAGLGIAWGYAGKPARQEVFAVVRKNILPIVFALFAVAVAIFLSVNTTLRLV